MLNRRVLTILILSKLFGVASCQRSVVFTRRTLSNRKAQYKPSRHSLGNDDSPLLEEDSSSPCRSVSKTEHRCLEKNKTLCTEWSTGELERGRCFCCHQSGLYCSLWICPHKGIEPSTTHHNRDRCIEISENTTRCSCFNASSKKDYCEEWYCTESAVDGSLQYEYYSCQEANKSSGICLHWKEDIRENGDGESSDCHCKRKGDGFCKRWNCTRRARCPDDEEHRHSMVWLIAGGGGLLFFAAGWILAYDEEFLKHWYPKGCLALGLLWFIAVFRYGATQLWPFFVVGWVLIMFIPYLVLKTRSWLLKKNATNQESSDGGQTPQNETESDCTND